MLIFSKMKVFFLVLTVCLSPCLASFNFYLNLLEVRRLLGLAAELFYVREGLVNEYALNFIVPVPAQIGNLHFTWQSLTGRPLPYTISVESTNKDALTNPNLNISTVGSIPTSVQTFSINLPCTGTMNAEVIVLISINVTMSRNSNNVTSLNFKRKKICLRDAGYKIGVPTSAPAPTLPPLLSPSSPPPPNPPSSSDLDEPSINVLDEPASRLHLYNILAICAACVLITVVVIYSCACFVRNKKLRRHGEILQNGSNSSTTGHTPFLLPAPVLNCGATSASSNTSYASFKRRPSYSRLDDRSKDLHEKLSELTIQRCRVRLFSVNMEGTFGRVYRGTYTEEDGVEEEVLVKTVTDHASAVQVSLLLQEGMAMYGLSHKNILTVLGVSIEDHTSPFLIYPYQDYTNLKRFLQKCKLCPEGVAHTLTTQEVVDMCLQIIMGVQYLHKKKLLHKDLATRNCVVDDKLRIQITDNALSRDLFPADYHCLGDNENRPVKWLAIESLVHKSFSTASDVWAFGVLLWELTTLAQQPYAEIDPFEMAASLQDGYRLNQPVNCPDELFSVMAYCWAMNPEGRPTFPQLHSCLQEFHAQLTRYV
uniref:receptor protein-tyrosine kinase n=1 Tax=Cacopsylla melanoneura TaxID=428564 RepID=A0A8D8M0B9_9HEMI